METLPNGSFDFTHCRALHRHCFQDVYVWGGERRGIRTGKDDNWFCYPEYIERLFGAAAASAAGSSALNNIKNVSFYDTILLTS